MIRQLVLLLIATFFLSSAQAKEIYIRWGHDTRMTDRFEDILERINSQNRLSLTSDDFFLVEQTPLSNYNFKTYVQISAGVPIQGQMIRTWADRSTGALVQMEAHIESPDISRLRAKQIAKGLMTLIGPASEADLLKIVKTALAGRTEAKTILSLQYEDRWAGTSLQRVIKVKAAYGQFHIILELPTQRILSVEFIEHPQFELPASVYPIYEEAEKEKGTLLERIPVSLTNIKSSRKLATTDPYASLRNQRYFEDQIDTVRGETPEGRAEGFWSPRWLLSMALSLYEALPTVSNLLPDQPTYLQGQFATINIHPDAVTEFGPLDFTPTPSGRLSLIWRASEDEGQTRYEIIPSTSFNGRPLLSREDGLKRIPRRLPDHDPKTYINDGFDEIQVYYAINKLMESLHGLGFDDPELSTRPFHAFLYDPDISMRDNAYYTSDTINFTTYSPNNQNYARDNSTIWHELGHGVMDRLMGDMITLTDSGGLSEGMADFVAQIVVMDVTLGVPFRGSKDFRINNRIGFNLTNESHDDGEAYGGAMNDMLQNAVRRWGQSGLHKFTDLTLDSMRLTRNNPGLDANGWFEHMLYADELGRLPIRAPNEMRELILSALQTRNFNLDRSPNADLIVLSKGQNLNSTGPGSRRMPIFHNLKRSDLAKHDLTVRLISGANYRFKYPVTVEVLFNDGPLQGAIHWQGEENGPRRLTLKSESDSVRVPLAASGQCDSVNRDDGSCVDYVYLRIINAGETLPVAKKRFYLRVLPQ